LGIENFTYSRFFQTCNRNISDKDTQRRAKEVDTPRKAWAFLNVLKKSGGFAVDGPRAGNDFRHGALA